MSTTCDTVTVAERYLIDVSGDRDTINIKDERLKIHNEYPDKLFVSEKWKILPTYSYNSTEYIIPEALMESIYIDINEVRTDLLAELAGQEVAIIDLMYYELTNDDGVIRRQFIELEGVYLSTGEAEEYILKTELTNMVIAQEYYIDKWLGTYIQDREDWDTEFVHTDGFTYTNDTYLDARWDSEAEFDEDGNLVTSAKDVAQRDYPLDLLYGSLIWDGDERVYRYKTDILAQDIYDLAIRVDNSYASYTSEIQAFANNQSAYVSELTLLRAEVDGISIELESYDGVFLGEYIEWDGDDASLQYGMWTLIDGEKYVFHGGTNGPNEDGWVPVGDSIYGWVGGAAKLLTNNITGAIVGWEFIDSPEVQNEFVIHADSFFITSSTIEGYQPFSIVDGQIKFDGIVEFSNVQGASAPVNNVCNMLYSNFNDFSLPPLSYASFTQVYLDQTNHVYEGKGTLRVGGLVEATSNSYVYLGRNSTDWNINLEPNSKWIMSAYVKIISWEGNPLTVNNLQLDIRTSDSIWYGNRFSVPFNVWTRVSFLLDMSTDSSTRGIALVRNRSNSGGSTTYAYFDNIQIEKYEGVELDPEPGPYIRPGFDGITVADAVNNNTTTIDGGKITAHTVTSDVFAGNVIYNLDASGNPATSGTYTMKIDLGLGEIHIV